MRIEKLAKHWQLMALALLMGAPLIWPVTAQAASILNFRGILVQEACTLRPGDESLELELLDVSPRYLYLNSRSIGKTFQIHLEGCNTSVGNSVTTTFSGNESLALPGLLALDGGSAAVGVAIGIETPAGLPLPLHVASAAQTLSSGTNVIELKAFIKGTPQAIVNQSITPGIFVATTTFTLNYP